jgi:hypothetical protein
MLAIRVRNATEAHVAALKERMFVSVNSPHANGSIVIEPNVKIHVTTLIGW